jgi:hypothetical protein
MAEKLGYKKADVIVAGGGTGGPIAAIAAARNGADVLLIEKLNCLGGTLTAGNMIMMPLRAWAGIGKEFVDRLFETKAAATHPDDPVNYPMFHLRESQGGSVVYNPEIAKIVLLQMCEEAGVRILLHTFVCGTVLDGNSLKGIIIENKSGRQVVMGEVVCDATGDGDVAAGAGVPFVKGIGPQYGNKMAAMTMPVRLSHVDWKKISEYSQQDPGWINAVKRARYDDALPYYKSRTTEMVPYWGHARPELAHLWHEDGALLWGGNVENVDGTDGDDLSRAEIECRKQWMSEFTFLQNYIPGFENARIEHDGALIGIRETRHIVGEYVYTMDDAKAERQFPDTVAYFERGLCVPYRCLLPLHIDNLLIASRCLSVEPGEIGMGPKRGVYSNTRAIVSMMSCAQAAGTAAALSVKHATTPRNLDVATLRKTLGEQSALVGQEVLDSLKSKRAGKGFKLFGQKDTFWNPVGGRLDDAR